MWAGQPLLGCVCHNDLSPRLCSSTPLILTTVSLPQSCNIFSSEAPELGRTMGTPEFLCGTSRSAGLWALWKFLRRLSVHLAWVLEFSAQDHNFLTSGWIPWPLRALKLSLALPYSQINSHWECHLNKYCLFHRQSWGPWDKKMRDLWMLNDWKTLL